MRKITKVLFIIVPIILGIVAYAQYKDYSKQNLVSEKTEEVGPECLRTERLNNSPQFDRPLSLIQQRIQESIERDKTTSWKSAFLEFPPNLVNCIYVKEEVIDSDSGIEGYFTFNGEDVKSNYFPITVDKKYKDADDVVTALLITHEMEHVQQFLNKTPMDTRNECLKAEAEAFIAQWSLFGSLSIEEMTSINARIEYNDFLHPQLQMIERIRELSSEYAIPACGFMEKKCNREVLKVQMFHVLFDDDFYKKQCEK